MPAAPSSSRPTAAPPPRSGHPPDDRHPSSADSPFSKTIRTTRPGKCVSPFRRESCFRSQEVQVALTSSFVRAVRIVMCAGGVGALSIPAAAQSPAPQAQEVRAELDKLRKEFEAVRDDYAARLAALESKLAAIGAPPAPAAPAPPAAGARRACRTRPGGRPGRSSGPVRRGRGRWPDGLASGLRQHERALENLQPRHRRDRELRRGGRGELRQSAPRAGAG